jgi:hypothetical protein
MEENAGAIRLFVQSEAESIVAQPGEKLNELVLGRVAKGSEPGKLCRRDPHLSWPATALCATFALVEDRHGADDNRTLASRPVLRRLLARPSLWTSALGH